MKVLVIIVSYNFEPWIDRCLGSLAASSYPVDVLVIDNASKDCTVQRIQTDYPHIRLIPSPTNLGFGRANNIGMQTALKEGYEAVFLMNQDAWIAQDAIGILIEECIKHPEYGILSPIHLTASGQTLDPGFISYTHIREVSQLPHQEAIVPLAFVNAAFWMIPTKVLKQVGGFSSLFYHYGEDKDFINRLTYHGFKVGYVPDAFGCHDREYRPMSHQKYLHTEYVYHLSEYANANYTFAKAFALGVLAPIKKALKALLGRKTGLCFDYLKLFTRLVAQSRRVIVCREKNIQLQPNYLQES